MDNSTLAHVATWTVFVVVATFITISLARSQVTFWPKAALILGSAVLLTIFFGVGRGLTFLLLCPLLLGLYSRKSDGAHVAQLAVTSARAFQQSASALGFAVQLPFKEKPHVAAFPLVNPDKSGITSAYADFAEHKLILVTKALFENTPDKREVHEFPESDFLPALFKHLETSGPKQQGDRTYQWVPPQTESASEAQRSPLDVAEDLAQGFLVDLECGESYKLSRIREFIAKRYPTRSDVVQRHVLQRMAEYERAGTVLSAEVDNDIVYAHKDYAKDILPPR